MTGRPVKACTECKQVKLRCDAKLTFPSPCSRCRERNLQCNVDLAFRRTPARQCVICSPATAPLETSTNSIRRVKELTNELQRARESLRAKEAYESATESAPQTSPTTVNDTPAFFALDEPLNVPNIAVLGPVTLGREEIKESFRIFSAHFYPHLPVIDVDLSVSAIYELCPLLFWTVIVVIQRINSTTTALDLQVREEYDNLFRREVFRMPLSLPSIHALLYLSTWPMPVAHQVDDPSWLYCGIIHNACLSLGLNHSRGQPLRSSGAGPDHRVGRQTWLGCFLTSTLTSSLLGLPPTVQSPTDLHNVSREFAAHISIQQHISKHIEFMSSHLNLNSTLGLVQTLEQELHDVKDQFSDCWSSRTEFLLLGAKLHLYSMAIVQGSRMKPFANVDPHPLRNRKLLIAMGFEVSCRMISIFNLDMVYSGDSAPSSPPIILQMSLPKAYFKYLHFGTMFLLKYFALDSSTCLDDQLLARNQIATSFAHFKACSRIPTDEPGRAAAVIEILSRHKPHDGHADEEIRTKDQTTASGLYDGLNSWGEELRGRPRNTLNPEGSKGPKDRTLEETGLVPAYYNVPGPVPDPSSDSTWDGLMNMIWDDPYWQMYGLDLSALQ